MTNENKNGAAEDEKGKREWENLRLHDISY